MKLHVNNLGCIRQQHPVFANISFTLNSGDALFIQGDNGCGKSSLLRLLTGLSTPAAGDISWADKDIQQYRADYYNDLHYVGHTNGIKLGLTVAENIELMRILAAENIADTDNVLTILQLSAHKNTQARYLSAGQKRRLALAKLFLFPKKLWVLDEPLTALDVKTQEIFLDALELHLEKGGISVISTHHSITFKYRSAQTLRLGVC